MSVISVVKTFHVKVVSYIIKAHIRQLRNPMNVINVVNHFHIMIIFEYIKEHLLGKNLMNVRNEVKPLYVSLIQRHGEKNIL